MRCKTRVYEIFLIEIFGIFVVFSYSLATFRGFGDFIRDFQDSFGNFDFSESFDNLGFFGKVYEIFSSSLLPLGQKKDSKPPTLILVEKFMNLGQILPFFRTFWPNF